jgi:PEP-CTERM motif
MARLSKVLLGIGLTWMFASGSAFAVLFDLGNITPGPGSFKPLGASRTPGVAFDDQYAFNLVGSSGAFAASVVSQQVTPAGDASLFDITAQLFEWNGTSFIALNNLPVTPGGAAIVPGPFRLVLPAATGGDAGGINSAYYLEIKGTPAAGAGNVAGYGGSLNLAAAVPEPSSLLLLLGGTFCAAFLGRRRLTSST